MLVDGMFSFTTTTLLCLLLPLGMVTELLIGLTHSEVFTNRFTVCQVVCQVWHSSLFPSSWVLAQRPSLLTLCNRRYEELWSLCLRIHHLHIAKSLFLY